MTPPIIVISFAYASRIMLVFYYLLHINNSGVNKITQTNESYAIIPKRDFFSML
jgi:hypothetical protein